VLLKDSTYLEVKNPDRAAGEARATFPTLDAWRTARVGDSTTAIIRNTECTSTRPKDNLAINLEHGFNVPTTDTGINKWFRWCYAMIAEAAPELFDSKITTAAYNDLVAVCAKYPELILCSYIGIASRGKRYNRYAMNNLLNGSGEKDTLLHNQFPVYMLGNSGMPYYNYMYNVCASDMTASKYASYSADSKHSEFIKKYYAIRADILPKCKALYDIIVPKLDGYLKKKTEIANLKERIEYADKYIQNAEQQLRMCRRQVKYFETELKSCQEAYKRLTGEPLQVKTVLPMTAAPAVAAEPAAINTVVSKNN
jgi:hypothetical protein